MSHRRPRLLTVVGARPQFIKAAALSPHLRRQVEEILVHTGQHYDFAMSAVFFEELPVPPPDHHLEVGAGPRAQQLAAMLDRLDPIMARERPMAVLVYGDTTSTLAGALAASQRAVPLVHVEAGLRSYDRTMPEEISRVVTDHLAWRLYCPDEESADNLAREGITEGVRVLGDVLDDALAAVRPEFGVLAQAGVSAGEYYLLTLHRAENADRRERLAAVLEAAGRLGKPVVFPVHPRTRQRLREFGLEPAASRLRLMEPVGYRAMLALERAAAAVLTDSGGVQREAAALGVPCYVLRRTTEWTGLVRQGRVALVDAEPDRIVQAVAQGWARPRPALGGRSPAAAIAADLAAALAQASGGEKEA